MLNDIFTTQFVVNLIRFGDAATQRRAGFPSFPNGARERARNKNIYRIIIFGIPKIAWRRDMKRFQQVVSLWDMISDIGGSLTAIANVVLLRSQLEQGLPNADNQTFSIRAGQFAAIQRDLEEIERISQDLNLDTTVHFAQYGLELLSRGMVGHDGELLLARNHTERLCECLDSIRISFLVQMNSKLVLVFGSGSAEYIKSDAPPFGSDVDDALPKASGEISEAAKCLALGRSTACVFHLMRAMELAVQKLAERLGKTDIEKEWGKLLADIAKLIEAMPKGANRNAWSAVTTHLYHVKQAWRNDTMHPKTTYTEVEAEAVFAAVRTFMVALVPMVSEAEAL
jgi:HEPN domain-containing protein